MDAADKMVYEKNAENEKKIFSENLEDFLKIHKREDIEELENSRKMMLGSLSKRKMLKILSRRPKEAKYLYFLKCKFNKSNQNVI